MTFLDTGILVGAVLEAHPHHEVCRESYEDSERPFSNAHALAETFATLTGFYKVPVFEATGVWAAQAFWRSGARVARRK